MVWVFSRIIIKPRMRRTGGRRLWQLMEPASRTKMSRWQTMEVLSFSKPVKLSAIAKFCELFPCSFP